VQQFTTSDRSALQQQAAQQLTEAISQEIYDTQKFEPVEPSVFAKTSPEQYGSIVEAYITGTVNSASVADKNERQTYTDKDGKEQQRTLYTRQARLGFTYSLVRARDGKILGRVAKPGNRADTSQASVSNSGKSFSISIGSANESGDTFTGTSISTAYDNPSELSSADSMITALVTEGLGNFTRDIVPYVVTEKRTLANETSKDKALKQQMKDAAAKVKGGSYKAALTAYEKIRDQTDSFAAAYNAAIVTEILGQSEDAIALMRRLDDEQGNAKTTAELARMQKTLADANAVESRFSGSDSARDKAVKQAVTGLIQKLPAQSNLSIINTSKTEEGLMGYVIAEMTKSIVNDSTLTLLDRQNAKLIQAELDFQLSGSVSDDEILSIGNALGVKTIVTVSITGTSSLRRLEVKAISVEKGAVLYSDSFEI
jgi:hypothetical protein